jgi:hypothetical protein
VGSSKIVFECVFFYATGCNLTGFGRHDNEINARGRETRRTQTDSPCE